MRFWMSPEPMYSTRELKKDEAHPSAYSHEVISRTNCIHITGPVPTPQKWKYQKVGKHDWEVGNLGRKSIAPLEATNGHNVR